MKKLSLTSFIWQFVKKDRLPFFIIALTSLVWSLDATIWPYILRVVINTLTQFEGDRADVWKALTYPIAGGLSLWIFVEIGFRTQGFL